jgi:two-component system, cell cycle sensor histidine kinase and response regulator CckA
MEYRVYERTNLKIYPAAPEQSEHKLLEAVTESLPQKRRILFMDEENQLRDVGKLMLERMGYDVKLASDGSEAIRLYAEAMEETNPFDVVILDLMVTNGMGAKAAIALLLGIDPGVKAIVSSGNPIDPAMSNFSRFGFAGALPKPYGTGDLYHALNRVIGASRST